MKAHLAIIAALILAAIWIDNHCPAVDWMAGAAWIMACFESLTH